MYVYGVTKHTAADDVRGYIINDAKITLPSDLKFDTHLYIYMANKLFEGIEKAIPRTVAAMRWLQAVARASDRSKPIRWTTPSGFLVQHDYPDHIDRRIQIRSANVRSILIRDHIDTTNTLRMANSISPNFIHSMDATHYTFTVDRARAEGIKFVGIHDSFGTHPCDVDALAKITREEFYRMYTEFDPVQDFIKSTGTQIEPPSRGSLDLSGVLGSTYFFS